MRNKYFAFVLVGVSVLILSLAGCESDEQNDLAMAQKCMDSVSSANYTAADACFAYVSKYETQQANILKCSIKFLGGGLTTQKIASAYKKIAENSLASKEATFITILALGSATRANEAQSYCLATGLKGLIYLGNLAVIGTSMASVITPGGYDPTDPTSVPTPAEINEALNNCKPPATCGGNFAAIGQATIILAESYCTGANATTDICTKINSAVTNSGGDTTLVAKQLFCALDGKTYDGISACIP